MLQEWMDRGCARLLCCWLSVSAAVFATAPETSAAEKPEGRKKPNIEDALKTLSKGTSSQEAQKQGLAELPLQQLTPAGRADAALVLKNQSLFRELPTLAIQADPKVNEFFLDNPEMAVSIWKAMKISKFQLKQTEPGVFHATDNAGTEGRVEILFQDQKQVLAICDGVVKSPLLPGAIHAKTLLHLQRDYVKSKDDTIWARNRVRMYVAFPSPAIEAAAKVVAPLGNLIIDRNLKEVCLFVSMMSAAMVHQPGWVEHTARQLEDVPKERQDELIELTAQVYVAARKRELEKRKAAGESITLDEIIRPIRQARGERSGTDIGN